ncbi:MAG: extracellular solute-binding protein [Caldilineaceae bacterium]
MYHPIRTLPWPTLICLLLFAACIPAEGSTHIPPELDCTTVLKQRQQPAQPGSVEVIVAARAYREFCWQLYGPVLAAQTMTTPAVRVIPSRYDMLGASYQQLMEQALINGDAPDLMQFDSNQLRPFAERGYLTPLGACIHRYSTFADILEPLWPFVMWRGQPWGVPYRIGMVLFYFNKLKLKELGWSQDQIEHLPQAIEQGEFTLDDLVSVAREGIATNVVQAGFGYWPYLDDPWTLQMTYIAFEGHIYDGATDKFIITKAALTKAYAFHRQMFTTGITHQSFAHLAHSFLDKTMWEDAVVHGRVLFWVGLGVNWPLLMSEYKDDLIPDVDPQAQLGYALYPSSRRSQPGHILWDSGAVYVIPSVRGSGRSNQEAACALLAHTLMPEINALHVARSGLMSVLKSQATHPAFQKNQFDLAQFRMWPHAVALPRQQPLHDVYTTILNSYLDDVQTGQLPAEVAMELAVQALRRQLGDALIIE